MILHQCAGECKPSIGYGRGKWRQGFPELPGRDSGLYTPRKHIVIESKASSTGACKGDGQHDPKERHRQRCCQGRLRASSCTMRSSGGCMNYNYEEYIDPYEARIGKRVVNRLKAEPLIAMSVCTRCLFYLQYIICAKSPAFLIIYIFPQYPSTV